MDGTGSSKNVSVLNIFALSMNKGTVQQCDQTDGMR